MEGGYIRNLGRIWDGNMNRIGRSARGESPATGVFEFFVFGCITTILGIWKDMHHVLWNFDGWRDRKQILAKQTRLMTRIERRLKRDNQFC
jgi:hypothetical protein